MGFKLFWLAMWIAVPGIVYSEVEPPAQAAPQPAEASSSAIRNGCINNILIDRVRFDSNTTGIIDLVGKRKVKITLKNRCPSISTQGYVHKPINNNFCEGDILRVIGYGYTCVVDTLEPYVEPTKEESTPSADE